MRGEAREGEGLVAVTATRAGEALLRDGAGAVWRLAWTSPDAGARTFALPAGHYEWLTYRLVEATWHVSVTGSPLGQVEVRAGATAPIDAKDGVALALRGVPVGRGVQAAVELAGGVGGGLSLYHEGRRVALTCAVTDDAGRALGSAPVSYG